MTTAISEAARFQALDDLTAVDEARAGGKAYNCARLKQAGFPVPGGVVVAADASEDDVLQIACDPWFDTVPADTRFAVRSSGIGEDSAGHSFAGIHETQLNVPRDQIVEAVIVCRRSARTDQAGAYRKARHLAADDVRIGVLVQQMVPAVISGVAFTVNPITGADEIVINAAPGLGEALVSGRVTPDEFRLSKSDLTVLSERRVRASGTSPLLDIVALGDLLLRIERHYGAPQDVEWCHDGRQFWIVQSRSITATARSAISNKSAISNLQSAIPDLEWTRANLAEVLPDQLSPQALDVYLDLLNRSEREFFARLMAPESELGPIVKSFHGRLYFNLSQLRRVTTIVGAAFADTLRSLGHSERIRPEDEIAARPRLGDVLRALPDLMRITACTLGTGRIFRRHAAMTERAMAKLAGADPRTASDVEIWSTFEWWLRMMPDTLTAVFTMSSVQFLEDALRKACRRVGFSYDKLVYPQLAAGERSVSTQQAFDLIALADAARAEQAAANYLLSNDGTFADFRTALAGTKFLDRFERFLDLYGHRGRYESDWALPRLHENPAPALFAIRGQLEGPRQDSKAIAERQEAEAREAMAAFEAQLTTWQKLTLLPRVRSSIRKLKQQYVWREKVRSDLTRVVSRVRSSHLALANRFVERGWIDTRDDYFLLHLDEVKRVCHDPEQASGLRAITARRAAERAAERDLVMPLFMRESELPALIGSAVLSGPRAEACDRRGLTGLCVSPGLVEAEVVVMRDPSEFAAMKRGAILVTTATDPSWTPLFTLASGVIVEVGGMLSHASTIAREYGLPALANVKDATRFLKSGDRVRLDASGGVATVL